MAPKISIIMGIYNCASTLPEAIDSILNQTFTDWELIMCDDGSTDSTYSVARKYWHTYPDKIVLLQNKMNKGLNFTLNKCLHIAKGEYIARMDGDDISLPERFQKEADFLDMHPEFAIVSTPMIHFDENGVWGRGQAIPVPKKKDFVFHAPCFCHAPCMIRKDAFLSVNGYTEDPFFLRFEDCNLWFKLYAAGFMGANLSEPLYKMRDDRNAYQRRTAKTRLKAVFVQWHGFRLIDMPLRYYPFLLLELIKGVVLSSIPSSLYTILHKRKLSL